MTHYMVIMVKAYAFCFYLARIIHFNSRHPTIHSNCMQKSDIFTIFWHLYIYEFIRMCCGWYFSSHLNKYNHLCIIFVLVLVLCCCFNFFLFESRSLLIFLPLSAWSCYYNSFLLHTSFDIFRLIIISKLERIKWNVTKTV